MQKNCANCKNSYIKDGCYLICEIDGVQNDVVENCENFEVDPDLISKLEKENKNLLKEIAEFTVANRMLQEVTKHQRQTLKEIKEIAESTVKPNILRTDGTAMYGIDRIIELAEVEE